MPEEEKRNFGGRRKVTGQALQGTIGHSGTLLGTQSFATKHSFSTDKDDEEREQLAKELSKDWNSGKSLFKDLYMALHFCFSTLLHA
ncbi:hypothetical protein RND71_035571 [Anisodus tanguticus]|uniref:Uncharacterized protein n=1 Tax=Anisodus tanguticus TaxID=243964 RepID=A0AAE1R4R1_9SOLA|nr:hypothetical protein RND71_035571 [Anisodus tanguticus]